MKNRLWKRLLVLVISGTLAAGTCLSSQAAGSVTAAEETADDASSTVTAQTTGEGTIEVSDLSAEKGDSVTVTAAPDDGYYLAQVRCTYNDGTEDVTELIEEEDGVYIFTMPADAATVTADFISITWDGTIDVTWYDPDEEVYTISYAAQLAGAAALNNGLFNNYPTVTYANGTYEIPYTTEEYLPYGSDDTYYNVYTQDGDTATVVGDISNVKAYCSTEAYGSTNPVNADSYWYGAEDFGGKTILLAADLDMGGSCSGDRTDIDSWSGPNYMPLGGQFSMLGEDDYSILSASFNGTLNGQGHIVYNIYCNRYSSDYTQGRSIGLIGRMGCHDSDSTDLYESPAVENVAVDGLICGNRAVGGIVGKNGQSDGSLIGNCLNFATVINADRHGVGGIAGAGWNNLTISSCANFGYVCCTASSNAGGISGSCEAAVSDCYNFGYVAAGSDNYSQALGTNNGGASWTNCYYLSGSSASASYPGVCNYSSADTFFAVESAETFATSDFLDLINDGGESWVLDNSLTIVSQVVQSCLENVSAYTSSLSSYDCSGFAIPHSFTDDTCTLLSISTTGAPVTEYTVFETLDLNDLQVWASYSDGSVKEITDYTVTVSSGSETFTEADIGSAVTVSVTGSCDDVEFCFSYALTITDTTLTGIEITTQPNTLYALGESFDPSGMVVTAAYANGVSRAVEDYTYEPAGVMTADTSAITVSYTYNDTTMTAVVAVTVLPDEAPAITDGVVQIENTSDMRWFANQVSVGNFYDAVLVNDVDLSAVSYTPAGLCAEGSSVPVQYYTGTFDGNDKTVTLALDTSSAAAQYTGLFAGLAAGGTIKDLTLSGTVCAAADYTGSAVGCAAGGRIENVTSDAAVTSSGNYTAGLVGYSDADTLVLISCVNNGTIAGGGSYTAGLLGCGTYAQIANCINNGSVSGVSYTAGISACSSAGTVIGCTNNGAVTGTGSYTGGIAGYGDTAEIRGCVNNEAVSGAGCIGGIAGYMTDAASVLAGCMNYGAVTGRYYAGGVLGQANAALSIRVCGNEGTVTGTATSGSYYAVGGLVGNLYTASIDSCYNAGDVTNAYRYVGGVAGYAYSDAASLTNCFNTGSVTCSCTSSSAYIGGVIGYMYYTMTLANSYSTGTLTYTGSLDASKVYIGGVGGYVSNTSSMTNTSNNYALEGTADVVFGRNTSFTDAMGAFVSADTLESYASVADGAESPVLGSAYAEDVNGINSGYPVLTWQNTTASEVIALIGAIGTVTTDSLTAIGEAFAAYAVLSAEEQAGVTNYDTLVKAYDSYLLIDTQADTDADTGADPGTDADPDTDGDTDTDADPGTDTDPDTDADTDTDTDADPGTDADPDTDADTDTDTDADTDTDTDADPGTDTDPDTDADTDTDTDADPGTDADPDTDADTDTDTDADPDTDADTDTDTDADPETDADTGAAAAETAYEAPFAASQTVTAAVLKKVVNVKAGVKLTWSASSDASGYRIYRKTGSGAYKQIAVINSAETTSYVDKKAKNGKAYTYKVTAFSNTASADSAEKKIVRLTQAKIKSVSIISSSKAQITVKKNKKAAGYQIVYSSGRNFQNKKTVTVRSRKQVKTVLKKLKAGKKYYVKVRSYKKSGGIKYYSAWSKVKTVKIKK